MENRAINKHVLEFIKRMREVASVINDQKLVEFWDGAYRLFSGGNWSLPLGVRVRGGTLLDVRTLNTTSRANVLDAKVLAEILADNMDKHALHTLDMAYSALMLMHARGAPPAEVIDVVMKIAEVTGSRPLMRLLQTYRDAVTGSAKLKVVVSYEDGKYVLKDAAGVLKPITVDAVTPGAVKDWVEARYWDIVEYAFDYLKKKVQRIYAKIKPMIIKSF